MPDINPPAFAVAILKYDLLTRFADENIFDEPAEDDAVRSQMSATEKNIEQQFTKGSPEFKNAVYLQLRMIAERGNNSSLRNFMGIVHQSIPDYLNEKDAQTRYDECLEDLDSTNDSSFSP